MFTADKAKEMLTLAGLFFDVDEEDSPEEQKKFSQSLNMNDAWCWACADCQHVPDDQLPEVAELFWRYGFAGVLYWVSEQNGGRMSEFHDNNRFIDFVRNEEKLRKEIPSSSQRAYAKIQYTLGLPPNPPLEADAGSKKG